MLEFQLVYFMHMLVVSQYGCLGFVLFFVISMFSFACFAPANRLAVWLWLLGSYQEWRKQEQCFRPMVFAKAIKNQMVPPCVEW